MEGVARGRERHEWRFRIGDAFPSDDPLARFVVAVGAALNDNQLSNALFVQADKPHERSYFFYLASSHLYEAAESFRRAEREWAEVRGFVEGLGDRRREEFERIVALASPDGNWPGNRLKEIRNSFFHYIRLDRTAIDAEQLALKRGLDEAADLDGSVVIEPDEPLGGIRALFADEAKVKTLTAAYGDDELEGLIEALANRQGDLNRFAQGALRRYLDDQPVGVVTHEARAELEGGREHGA